MTKRLWRIVAAAAVVLVVAVAGVYGAAWFMVDRAGWARAVIWLDADVNDYKRFPARTIAAGDHPYTYEKGAGYPDGLPAGLALPGGAASLEGLLAANQTTAFLVIKDDKLIYEHYFNGSSHEAVQTSFSVVKSFDSAMLGAALADGTIASIDDPITKYLPELLERDQRFGAITIRNLVTMASGIHYEEHGLPWSDDALTYYAGDLRKLALTHTWIERPPGEFWHYTNYNPLLFGMILERASGMHAADYLSQKLWRPIGAEADATWSLDSSASGFEKMESGLNARAIDFAKLGSLYLHHGQFNGARILPADWVDLSTSSLFKTGIGTFGYGFWWWADDSPELGHAFLARGNKGQFIFVFPAKNLVIVRQGIDYGSLADATGWDALAVAIAQKL